MKMISNKEDILIKPIFPVTRLKGTNTAMYNSVTYDICMDKYNEAIELKSSRKSIAGRNFDEEIGSDIYEQRTKNTYDKDKKIQNVDIIEILEEYAQSINQAYSKQEQASKSIAISSYESNKNSSDSILDIFA